MKNKMTAVDIIKLIENRKIALHVFNRKINHAAVKELVSALQMSKTSHQKELLCYTLGKLQAKSSIPLLLQCLDHPDGGVRGQAAQALAEIGDKSFGRKSRKQNIESVLERFHVGEALLRHLLNENEDNIKASFAVALGAIRYEPAIDSLVALLADRDGMLRAMSAWALGYMQAQTAQEPIRKALMIEKFDSAKDRMQKALRALETKGEE